MRLKGAQQSQIPGSQDLVSLNAELVLLGFSRGVRGGRLPAYMGYKHRPEVWKLLINTFKQTTCLALYLPFSHRPLLWWFLMESIPERFWVLQLSENFWIGILCRHLGLSSFCSAKSFANPLWIPCGLGFRCLFAWVIFQKGSTMEIT